MRNENQARAKSKRAAVKNQPQTPSIKEGCHGRKISNPLSLETLASDVADKADAVKAAAAEASDNLRGHFPFTGEKAALAMSVFTDDMGDVRGRLEDLARATRQMEEAGGIKPAQNPNPPPPPSETASVNAAESRMTQLIFLHQLLGRWSDMEFGNATAEMASFAECIQGNSVLGNARQWLLAVFVGHDEIVRLANRRAAWNTNKLVDHVGAPELWMLGFMENLCRAKDDATTHHVVLRVDGLPDLLLEHPDTVEAGRKLGRMTTGWWSLMELWGDVETYLRSVTSEASQDRIKL